MNQIVGEIRNVVAADSIADQAKLLKMDTLRDVCLVEAVEQYAEVFVKFLGKLGTETSPLIAGQ
jgi:hypothetical protein